MKPNRERNKGRRIALIAVCAVLALVLCVILGVTIYMESKLNKINRVDNNGSDSTLSSSEIDAILEGEKDPSDGSYTGPTMNAGDVTWADDVTGPLENSHEIINVLLIGQDRRPGESRARSDAMILCTVNKVEKKITMTSFLRDLYVQIPGYKDNRINVSYALGGMQLLDACIEKNFGVHVDFNVEVDFSGFEKVIDAVDGIEIELSRSEVNHLNGTHSWSLKQGMNRLSGAQALAYYRIRHISNEESGDFGRTNRQRIVLTKLIEKAKTMSLREINSLLDKVLPMLTTDLTDSEILGYVMEMFPLLSDLKIETGRVPADGSYIMTMIDEMSVLVPDLEESRQQLKEIMGG